MKIVIVLSEILKQEKKSLKVYTAFFLITPVRYRIYVCDCSRRVAIFHVGNIVFTPLKSFKNIDYRWGWLPRQEAIVLHTFKGRITSVAKFQESSMLTGMIDPHFTESQIRSLHARACRSFFRAFRDEDTPKNFKTNLISKVFSSKNVVSRCN